MTDDKRMREANNQTTSERGARPQDFNEAQPINGVGAYYNKPSLPNNAMIQCCANVMNIPIGDVNNAVQKCNQTITNLINDGASAATGPQVSNGSNPEPANDSVNDSTNALDSRKIYAIVGVVMVLVLSISISSSAAAGLLALSDD